MEASLLNQMFSFFFCDQSCQTNPSINISSARPSCVTGPEIEHPTKTFLQVFSALPKKKSQDFPDKLSSWLFATFGKRETNLSLLNSWVILGLAIHLTVGKFAKYTADKALASPPSHIVTLNIVLSIYVSRLSPMIKWLFFIKQRCNLTA